MIKTTFKMMAALGFCCLFSCKKEKQAPIPPAPDPTVTVVYDNYTKLHPGNYWIYQNYRLDSINGAAHPEGTFDSSYVEKDTTIGMNVYHKYCDATFQSNSMHPSYNTYFLRDSLSYTVNEKGIILFSSEDFTHVFRSYNYGPNAATPDTLLVTEQMGFKDVSVTVDAGTFVTSALRRIYHYPAGYPYGATREYDYRYAKNLGLISETTGIYNATPEVYERRLVRYHVQ